MSNFASKDLTAGQLNALVKKVGGHQSVLKVLSGEIKFNFLSGVATSILQAEDTPYLKFLQSAELGATSGSVTIAGSGDVFKGYLDPDFKTWGTDKSGKDTSGATALIYEMKKDGTFSELFNSFNTELRSLIWQQAEIVLFCQTHRHLLRQNGYGTFFLFEVEGQLFVASVNVDGDELRAYVYRFEYGRVWSAGCRHRLVLPQQTA